MSVAFLAPQTSSASQYIAAPQHLEGSPQLLWEVPELATTSNGSTSAIAVAGAFVAAVGVGATRNSTRRVTRKAGNTALALPMLPEPAYRQVNDKFLAECDAGFDPLNLAMKDSPFGAGIDTYYNYREAEVKHGRLAMLATVGWLSSEELQASLARKLGLADDLAPGELAPSLLNGGLGNLPSWFLPAVFMVSAWIEWVPRQQGNRDNLLKYKPQQGRLPGDLSFDPLSLQATITATGTSLEKLHNAEVKHGRAAMLGIVGFVIQEFITKVPVLSEDEISADRIVETLDKGIAAVDKAAGLAIPTIPDPFPISSI
jgi:hypothetical protein